MGHSYDCADCSVDTLHTGIQEYYMVRHELWKEFGAGRRLLCIGCLEARLGRELQARDFLPVPINGLKEHHSDRLRDRLTAN